MSLGSATRAAVSATTNKASWRRPVAALACATAAPHGCSLGPASDLERLRRRSATKGLAGSYI